MAPHLEQSLFAKVRSGDGEAFAELYRAYYAKLCYIARHIIGDPGRAEEVVDDVMLYLWDHKLDIADESIEGYLVRAVRHRSINAVKSADARRGAITDPLPSDSEPFFARLFTDNDPLERLLSEESASIASKVIDSLPEQARRIWTLSRQERMRQDDIARQLGISVATVKYHMRRAKDLLSNAIIKFAIVLLIFLI